MKKICFLVITGLCITIVSFGQEKESKKTPPPPPPPEIVKDIKIENVKDVEPPPPPPPPPAPPKKPRHMIHSKENSWNDSRTETIVRDSSQPGKIIDKITITESEPDTVPPPPPPPKKPKHVVRHKVKTVVVQPKDPGKPPTPKKPATSI